MVVDPGHPAAKRTRASSSKVRTGCITCKIRHIKCDEGKPHCGRCTSTGRKCDGYATPGPTNAIARSMVVLYVAPQHIPRAMVTLPKNGSIHDYHRHVAPKLSVYFDSSFWRTLIPQMSQQEPAIQHAVSAVTAVHSLMEGSPDPFRARRLRADAVALKEIGLAMQSLRARIEANPSSGLVPLVACLLFTCLECMRGSVESAIRHMMSGFKILNAAQASTAGPHKSGPSELQIIRQHVVPFFNRLNLLCISFGQVTPSVPVTHDMQAKFGSLDDARQKLYDLGYLIVSFIRTYAPRAEVGSVTLADVIEQTKLQRQVDHWRNNLEEYSELNAVELTSTQLTAANLCRIHARTLSVWLAVCLNIDECTLDQHVEHFESIIDLGERIITAYAEAGENGQPPKFAFEMGVIPSLYYTAIKCRVRHIRRRALALLRRAPRREGLWNAHVATRVAETVIELEGDNVTEKDTPSHHARICAVGPASAQLPIHVVKSSDLLSTMTSLPSPNGPSSNARRSPSVLQSLSEDDRDDAIEVKFRAQAWGLNGEWASWKQRIYL